MGGSHGQRVAATVTVAHGLEDKEGGCAGGGGGGDGSGGVAATITARAAVAATAAGAAGLRQRLIYGLTCYGLQDD